jgi:hypothetical protein
MNYNNDESNEMITSSEGLRMSPENYGFHVRSAKND